MSRELDVFRNCVTNDVKVLTEIKSLKLFPLDCDVTALPFNYGGGLCWFMILGSFGSTYASRLPASARHEVIPERWVVQRDAVPQFYSFCRHRLHSAARPM